MRENRTSGTVRGAPGNRRSYRAREKKQLDTISFLREELTKKLMAIVLLLPTALLLLLFPPIREYLIETLPTLIPNKTLCLLLYLSWCFLLVLVAFTFLSCGRLKKQPNFINFVHDPNKQCWIHETTGQRICEACKTENKLTPLSKFGSGWKCPLHSPVVDYHADNGAEPVDTGELIPTIPDNP